MSNLDTFIQDVIAWQHETFPHSTAATVTSHLIEELHEIEALYHAGLEPDPIEAADVLMLLIAFADKAGFDLIQVARDKLEINKRRKWTVTAAGGHTKHEL